MRKKVINKKIFICWKGDNSKNIAIELKNMLENEIFENSGLCCFVSEIDIQAGDDWWNKIKKELKSSSRGIICITKENLQAPWVFFESGAMISHDIFVTPLLFNCNIETLKNTPLHNTQMFDFYNQERFINLMININEELHLTTMTKSQLTAIVKVKYNTLLEKLSSTLKELKKTRIFNEKYVYPKEVKIVNLDTLYICAPMSSVDQYTYSEFRKFLLTLKPMLEKIGFNKIICPIFNIETAEEFDGNTKAIIENFRNLKQVENMLVFYPKNIPTSVLVEIGYGLGLCKKMVIFYKDDLPYILKDASTIPHVDTRHYSDEQEIYRIIESNGKQLFKLTQEEDE